MAVLTEMFTRLFEALVIAVIGYVWKLQGRVAAVERNQDVCGAERGARKELEQSQASNASERSTRQEERLEKALDAMANFGKLMERVETLLETGLKRLDILEKHVFKID